MAGRNPLGSTRSEPTPSLRARSPADASGAPSARSETSDAARTTRNLIVGTPLVEKTPGPEGSSEGEHTLGVERLEEAYALPPATAGRIETVSPSFTPV